MVAVVLYFQMRTKLDFAGFEVVSAPKIDSLQNPVALTKIRVQPLPDTQSLSTVSSNGERLAQFSPLMAIVKASA